MKSALIVAVGLALPCSFLLMGFSLVVAEGFRYLLHFEGAGLRWLLGQAGVLAIFHDVGYIETQSARMWRATFWHVIAEVLLIVLITVLIIRWTIVLPITRTAQWMKDIRRGRVLPSPPGPKESFLAPFTNEVMNLTRSLADARSAAEEEARLRESGESVWTAERLRVSIRRDRSWLYPTASRTCTCTGERTSSCWFQPAAWSRH